MTPHLGGSQEMLGYMNRLMEPTDTSLQWGRLVPRVVGLLSSAQDGLVLGVVTYGNESVIWGMDGDPIFRVQGLQHLRED